MKHIITALLLTALSASAQVILPPPTDNQTAVADWSLNPAKQGVDFDGFGASNATQIVVDTLTGSNRTRRINLLTGTLEGDFGFTNVADQIAAALAGGIEVDEIYSSSPIVYEGVIEMDRPSPRLGGSVPTVTWVTIYNFTVGHDLSVTADASIGGALTVSSNVSVSGMLSVVGSIDMVSGGVISNVYTLDNGDGIALNIEDGTFYGDWQFPSYLMTVSDFNNWLTQPNGLIASNTVASSGDGDIYGAHLVTDGSALWIYAPNAAAPGDNWLQINIDHISW